MTPHYAHYLARSTAATGTEVTTLLCPICTMAFTASDPQIADLMRATHTCVPAPDLPTFTTTNPKELRQ